MPWRRSLIVLLILAVGAQAGDWPQWLGPNRDSTTPEKVAPWKEPPKALWKHPVGEGHSSPIVAGGKLFLHTKVKDKDDEELIAFDAASGKELWKAPLPRGAFTANYGNGPRATPAVDGDRIYTLGITGYLTCLQIGDKEAKQLWQVDLLKKFEAKNLLFGVSASPVVDGDRVIVCVGGKGAGVVAFDKMKGEVVWKSLDDKASYASPVFVGEGKNRQLIALTQDAVVSLDPTKGQEQWRFPFKDALFESSCTPVKVGDTLVVSSITKGSAGVKLETKDDKSTAKEEWKNAKIKCYFSTPLPVGQDQIYMVTGMIPLPGVDVQADLCCVEPATGKLLWTQPKVGKFHAALIRTGDNKLLMLDDNGTLTLIDPNAKEFKELAKAKVSGPETWAHPALADGKLYVRDGEAIFCIPLTQ